MASARTQRHATLALAVYVLLTLLQGRLVVGHATDHLPSDAGDPVLNLTILAWTSRHTPLSRAWWTMPGFAPLEGTLTFSEHLSGLAPIANPLLLATGDPELVYNVLFLFSFVASAMAAYALAYVLTGRAEAAFLAGLIFGFAPYRAAHLSHIQVLSAYWMPVALLGLHRFVATSRARWAALAAAAWLLQGLTNSYLLVHGAVLVVLWVLWFLVWQRRWRALTVVGVAFGVAALAAVPLLAQYAAAHAELGLRRELPEIRSYSADVLALFNATSRLEVWGWVRLYARPEGELFPGVALPILIVSAAVAVWRQGARAPGTWPFIRRFSRALAIGGAVCAAAAVSFWVAGPWAVELNPVRLSVSHADKPVTLAVALLAAAVCTSDRFRTALQRSSPLAFYGVAAVATWLLALGPTPTAGGTPILYAAPYEWLLAAPGVDYLRVPARFWLLTLLCVAMVAALLLSRATAGAGLRQRAVLTTLLAAGLAADGWTTVPVVPAPSPIPLLERHARGSHVLELPLGGVESDAAAQYRAALGGWRTINGYSGHAPPHYASLREALETQPDNALRVLRGYGPLVVAVAGDDDARRRWTAVLQRQPGAAPIATPAGGAMLFRMAGQPPVDIEAPTRRTARVQSVASPCRPNDTSRVVDRNVESRWECGDAEKRRELVVELVNPSMVAAVTQLTGHPAGDASAALNVETSQDGRTWERGWHGPIAAAALAGSLADPLRNPVSVTFEPRLARFLRLRHMGQPGVTWWIAELAIGVGD